MAIMPIVSVIQQCDAPDGFGPKTSESFLQFLIEPGAGVGPGSLGRAFGNLQQPRRLDIRQTGKETQLDQLRAERITRRLRRAFSTRMRRIASAAAAKKWPRPFHSWFAPPVRRNHASCTSAVGCKVWPGISLAILCAANRRSSS